MRCHAERCRATPADRDGAPRTTAPVMSPRRHGSPRHGADFPARGRVATVTERRAVTRRTPACYQRVPGWDSVDVDVKSRGRRRMRKGCRWSRAGSTVLWGREADSLSREMTAEHVDVEIRLTALEMFVVN